VIVVVVIAGLGGIDANNLANQQNRPQGRFFVIPIPIPMADSNHQDTKGTENPPRL
jgi:hypothetical protein